MAGISASGLGSGLDINGIISKLMEVERRPLGALVRKEASQQAKLTAFGSLKGALSALQTAAAALKNASTFTGMSATLSDSTVLTASASASAAAGTYNIDVTRLANFHALRSNTDYTTTTDTFSQGTLSIAIGGGTAVNVTINASNNTLAGIRTAINEANAGVTASIVNDGSTNRLVLASKTSGTTGAISVSVTDSASGGTHALAGLASAGMVETQPAGNAALNINGITISRSSNTITNAVEGLTLSLKKGGATTLTVAQNTGAVTAAVNAFVKAYNDAISQIRSMTAYDAANGRASVLTGDSTARGIQSQLAALASAQVTGIAGGITRLSDLGIQIQANGTLATDSGKLAAALADKDIDVAAFFTRTAAGNEGIAVRFNTVLEGIVGSSGLIAGRTDGINATIKDIQKRGEFLNLRLEQIEKRYRAQFTALDTLISSMNQTSQFLSQQLANLPRITTDR